MNRKRNVLLAALVILVPSLWGGWWLMVAAQPDDRGGVWHKVAMRAVDRTLVLNGTLLPAASVNVVSPVDGRIVEFAVQYGGQVAAGQLLARIESPELLQQLREAQVASIRAEQELRSARELESGSDYQAAMRRAAAANAALAAAARRLDETQVLFDKGIVARSELDGVRQEVRNGEDQVQAVRDELALLDRRRSPQALQLLQLELQSRRERLAELEARRHATRIVAPIAGIVLYPMGVESAEATPGGGVKDFRAGSSVSTRDVIATIGEVSAFSVKTRVDEADLQHLKVGQAATVVIGGAATRELSGHVKRIASQARTNDSRGLGVAAVPEFEVQVQFARPDGMTPRVGAVAKVKLQLQDESPRLYLPLAALAWNEQGRPAVHVRGESGGVRLHPIEIGSTTVDEIEVRNGLSEGDEVWIGARAPQAPAASGGLLRRIFGGLDADE